MDLRRTHPPTSLFRLLCALGLSAWTLACGDSADVDAGADRDTSRDAAVIDGGGPVDRDAELRDADLPDGGDGGVPPSIALLEYCDERAALYFDFLQYCYGQDPYPEEEREAFVERISQRCRQADRAVDEGRLGYDGTRASACISATDTMDCATNFAPPVCEEVFSGLLPEGADCYIEESLVFLVGVSACAQGICVEDQACPGTCELLPARDEACLRGQCGPADYCDEEVGVCRAKREIGAVCAAGNECPDDARCVVQSSTTSVCTQLVTSREGPCSATALCAGPSVCIEGRCESRVSVGEVCAVHGNCPSGAFCDDGICRVPAGPGAACRSDRGCTEGLRCDQSDPENAVCVALPGDGEACVQGACIAGTSCRYGEDDDQGTCRVLVQQGADCLVFTTPDPNRCEAGLFCVEAGTCEPTGDLGEPCNVFEPLSCSGNRWCSRATGLCVEPVGQGEACNPFWANACQPGLGCACGALDHELCGSYPRIQVATDTCQPLEPPGGPCFRQTECETGICDRDFEAPPETPGVCGALYQACLP